MGCDLTTDKVTQLVAEAKDGFAAWVKLADAENVAKCKRIWDEYDADKSGTMDLEEINAVIAKLNEMGFKPQPMSASDMADGELDFDEFSAWFLKQEGLPDDFSAPKAGAGPPGGKKKGPGKVKRLLTPLAKNVRKVKSGPQELLKKSGRLKKGGTQEREAKSIDAEAQAREMMQDRSELIFAEYVFMMRAGTLKQYLPGDWQSRAEDMRKLREAFDCADVDGNNELEMEELEMVVVSMNPKADVSTEDIEKVWAVLNPDGKDWIPFSEYVAGMIKVKRDPELSGIIPMDVPNRFQLLSLLIDSPINEDQERLLFKKMNGLEKMAVKALQKGEQKPVTPHGRLQTAGCALTPMPCCVPDGEGRDPEGPRPGVRGAAAPPHGRAAEVDQQQPPLGGLPGVHDRPRHRRHRRGLGELPHNCLRHGRRQLRPLLVVPGVLGEH